MSKDTNLNLDFSKRVIIESEKLAWTPSPIAGVERKRFQREAAESGRATSVVRYLPGVSFKSHAHPGGEEFLVLEGTFSDSYGDSFAGSYVRNPPGSSHQPSSKDGCTIFVKLCQMKPEEKSRLVVDTNTQKWEAGLCSGHEVLSLFVDSLERVSVEMLASDAVLSVEASEGEEIFTIEGELLIDGVAYGPRSWIRIPLGQSFQLASKQGCKFWVKRGHLKA